MELPLSKKYFSRPGQIYAQIVAHNSSFKTGDEVHLKCRVDADGDYEISWLRNGQPLARDARISHPKQSQLLIKGVTTDDQGTYTCLVTRDQNQVSVDTRIEVEGWFSHFKHGDIKCCTSSGFFGLNFYLFLPENLTVVLFYVL